MSITNEFREAIKNKDTRMVRIMLKDSLVVDPTFKEFNEMSSIAEANIADLYDEHDGELLKYDSDSMNNKRYMDEQMIQVIYNFSKERINLLKNICQSLYSERIKKSEKEVAKPKYKTTITKKEISGGLLLAGAVATGVGIVAKAPIVIGAGAVVGVIGTIGIIKER